MSLRRHRARAGRAPRRTTVRVRAVVVVLALASAAATAAAVAGCGRVSEPPPAPVRGGTLRIAVPEQLDDPYWIAGMNPTTQFFFEHVVPPLARIDANGRMHPYASTDVLDHGAAITFPLRRTRWSDGVPVEPRDYVLATELLRDPRARSPERARTDLMRDARAEDGHLRLEFNARYWRRVRDALVWPLPAHAWNDSIDPVAWGPRLSSGPFRLVSVHGRRMVLARHDESGYAPVFVDTVQVTMHEPAEALAAFRAGALDVIDDVPVALVPELRRAGARVIALVGGSYVFIGWNLRDERLRDVAVRRALAQAVDVDALMRRWTLGQGVRARGPLVAAHAFADTHSVLPMDRRAAERALAAAGFTDSDRDGVRDRRGARLSLQILAPDTDSLRIGIARDVATALRAVGVGCEVSVIPLPQFLQRLRAGAFSAFIGHWFPDPGLNLDPVWRSTSVDRFNFGGYADRVADSLLTAIWNEEPRGGHDRALAAFQSHVYAAQPYLFLFQMPRFLALAPAVQNAAPDVVSPFWNLPGWWLAPQEPRQRRRGARTRAHAARRHGCRARGNCSSCSAGPRRGPADWRRGCCD